MALTDLKNRTAPTPDKITALLNALPEEEASELRAVLQDEAVSLNKLHRIIQEEAHDPQRDNGVDVELYNISERTLYRWRDEHAHGTAVKGL